MAPTGGGASLQYWLTAAGGGCEYDRGVHRRLLHAADVITFLYRRVFTHQEPGRAVATGEGPDVGPVGAPGASPALLVSVADRRTRVTLAGYPTRPPAGRGSRMTDPYPLSCS
jgi:hypothetical protein